MFYCYSTDKIARAPVKRQAKKKQDKKIVEKQQPPPSDKKYHLLSSDSEDEKDAQRAAYQASLRKKTLRSHITRRVADGVLRREGELSGDTYIELRVYNTKDILGVSGWKERLEKASLALQYQADAEASEIIHLKSFIKVVKEKLSVQEGKFFGNTKKN